MESSSDPITTLTAEESWQRLATAQVGRLVTHVAGVIDITPINFVVDAHASASLGEGGGHRSIVFRTAPGDKLAKVLISGDVVFEADQIAHDGAWSVIVRGSASVLDSEAEILEAESLPLRTFVPTLKTEYVRIVPAEVTGRSFVFGEEPRREDHQLG